MIETFVKRPATTIILVSIFMVMGIVSYFNLNVERTPSVKFPLITVRAIYPGATPEELEIQVLKKIEDAVSEISQVKKMNTFAYENFGYVLIEFLIKADVNIKSIEVKDKVDAIINDLPAGVEKPIIEQFDPLAVPVMDLVFSGKTLDMTTLYEFADKKLKPMIAAIQGVAKVDLFGGRIRQINVKLDPLLMKKYFLSITDVIGTMKRKNLNIPGGTIDKVENSFNVRFLGEFTSIDEIKKMRITTSEGTQLTLDEVAIVEDGYRKVNKIARYNGEEVVGVSIIKVADGNGVKIAKDLQKKLPQINKLLPKGSTLKIAVDSSIVTQAETADTGKNILIGIFLTVIILFLFTGKIATTFIASIVIPTSLISALFLIDLSSFSLNMMTLLAIGTALGTLIANAIVIIESANKHMDMGKDSTQAAIDGTKDVMVAVLASIGTNLVVFTPIAFMGGLVGKFMVQFGMTVIFVTIFSLIASFSLTPMLFALLMKKRSTREFKIVNWVHKGVAFLLKEYRYIFDLIFKHPKKAILLIFLSFIGSFLFVPYMGNDFSPPSDESQVRVSIKMPQGSTIDRTKEVSILVEKILQTIPEGTGVLSSIGTDGVENATLKLTLVPVSERSRSDLEIIEELTPQVALIPDAEVHLLRGDGMGKSQIGDIGINVYGIDYKEMIANAKEMAKMMEESGYFRSVTISYRDPKDEVRFRPDDRKMEDYGVPNALVAQTLRASIYGDDSNLYKERGEEYDINIEVDEYYKQTTSDISQIHIISRKGLLPITSLGKLETKKALPMIRRRDKDRVIFVEGVLAKSSTGVVTRVLDNEYFSKMKFKEGHGYRHAGDAEMQKESEAELGKAFLLAAILTYMILVAILNSFIYPIAILTTVVTSLVGVIFILLFTGLSINIGSLLAIIMLVGLVVNNAILMLEVTIRNIEKGMGIIDALWAGIESKFQVILMTTIAIIVGALPQLSSTMAAKASIGAVIVGGMIASIPYTLLLVPVMFWYSERLRRKLSRS